jgi:hypothetical protein
MRRSTVLILPLLPVFFVLGTHWLKERKRKTDIKTKQRNRERKKDVRRWGRREEETVRKGEKDEEEVLRQRNVELREKKGKERERGREER